MTQGTRAAAHQTRDGRLVLAAGFSPEDIACLRAALRPGFDLEVAVGMDQRAVDDSVGRGVVGLIAHARPSDWRRAPDLRWQQALSAGVEHLVGIGNWPERVTLTNARGVYAISIGQYVMGAILRVAEQMDARVALQEARRWPDDEGRFVGGPLRRATLVVVGYGGTGREIARLAAAFGMRVRAVKARPERRTDDSFRLPGTGDPDGSIPELIVGMDRVHEAVTEADFVAVTVPLTAASRGLIDAQVLAALPPHAWLINTGRGAVVDQAALTEALLERRIGGAVLDVFEEEPLPVDSPLWTAPGAILTPHVSGLEEGGALRDLVAENVARFTRGQPLVNVVDPARGY
jgi:phosphoglycerate dehydrogenase-like enzyme